MTDRAHSQVTRKLPVTPADVPSLRPTISERHPLKKTSLANPLARAAHRGAGVEQDTRFGEPGFQEKNEKLPRSGVPVLVLNRWSRLASGRTPSPDTGRSIVKKTWATGRGWRTVSRLRGGQQ